MTSPESGQDERRPMVGRRPLRAIANLETGPVQCPGVVDLFTGGQSLADVAVEGAHEHGRRGIVDRPLARDHAPGAGREEAGRQREDTFPAETETSSTSAQDIETE